MTIRLPALALAALSSLFLAGSALAQTHTITGDLAYRERIALPESAVATVSLLDVSLADAPSRTLAEQVIDPAGQIPIGFVLEVDASAIEAGHTYALAARIEVEGELWFITDTRNELDPLAANEPIGLELVRALSEAPGAEAEAAMPAELAGTAWRLSLLGAEAANEGVESTLRFEAGGASLGGNGGCNSYGGNIAFAEDGSFAIGQVAATLMACDPASMEQEQGFFAALQAATAYGIEGDTLILIDAEGNRLATLTAEAAAETPSE
ncbi:YbaY family lipoprotein [Pelagibacterium lacus]|uniref:META domain-containing protein n=1 Tax=Pelagibacterium lacus TaxID=2282655 RepID=A0A369W7Z1_9HYPH|nr:YbaY family lipoprotein [Pelagibacterium lacus]RDE09372.1 META domain-containing protein [Pelagibacterium lacus]